MGLGKDLDSLTVDAPKARFSCLVRTILQSLNESDRQALEQVLANPTISSASISRTLIANNIMAKQGVIGKHRKGDCSCNVLG